MNRRSLLIAALLGTLAAPAALATTAAPAQGRLERIKETGVMVIAHGETGVPFSYVVQGGTVGFGVDISKGVAEAVRQHLGMKELKIRWNPQALTTRFMLITTGTVDLECTTTTNTRARQQMVAFSNTFFISDEGIATRRNSGIRDYPDLAGKRVAVVRGTTTERALLARNISNMTLVPERNNRRAMAAVDQGRADAYIAAASIAAGEMLRLPDASPFHIVGSGGYKEAFGCMLPKGDAAYKAVVDGALAAMMTSGEMERIYNKWFSSPIPPYGRNVNFPLTDDNRALYRTPVDTAYE